MSRLKQLLGLCCGVVAFVFIVTIYLDKNNSVENWHRRKFSVQYVERDMRNYSVVLLWTTFFGEKNYVKSSDQKMCAHQDCVFTSNRSLIAESKVVVFHLFDIASSDLPKYRRSDQIWMLFILESPMHTGTLQAYNGLFNWTATYRMDSDIWTPYAHITKLPKGTHKNDEKNYVVGKTKLVSWFTSNCNTAGGREFFVDKLKMHINVDIYGACGNLECYPKMSFDCYGRIAREYYFYLSFENSICKDYATEKFFHILKFDMVPVVFGGANYSAIAPPGSYIDALNFATPKLLAEYLTTVARNKTLYNSYFSWRKTHTFGGYHWNCEVCRRISSNQLAVKSNFYTDLDTWWITNSKCLKWTSEGLEPS